MGLEYKSGFYKAAGVFYPETDLFGYPDTLIRARVDIAYKFACQHIALVQSQQTILDIGSCHGHGVDTIHQNIPNSKVISGDRWLDFLQAQKRVMGTYNLTYVALNATNLPFKTMAFDAIFLMHVVEHIKKPDEFLQHLKRLIKSDGKLFVATPNRQNIVGVNSADEHVYVRQELDNLLRNCGYKKLEVYSVNPNRHAWEVHKKKKWLSDYLPVTANLRKRVNWRMWDRLILQGGLTSDDFSTTKEDSPRSIDLIAVASVN